MRRCHQLAELGMFRGRVSVGLTLPAPSSEFCVCVAEEHRRVPVSADVCDIGNSQTQLKVAADGFVPKVADPLQQGQSPEQTSPYKRGKWGAGHFPTTSTCVMFHALQLSASHKGLSNQRRTQMPVLKSFPLLHCRRTPMTRSISGGPSSSSKLEEQKQLLEDPSFVRTVHRTAEIDG